MKIELTSTVYADLRLLAQAWRIDESGAVERLIAEFRSEALNTATPVGGKTDGDPDWVKVHADYEGNRVNGEYHMKTKAVRVTDGIRDRRTFKSPSGAAIAVVSELNPKVNPNRNGWTFWNVSASGDTLQQLRHR
jgi:hypothetical protein